MPPRGARRSDRAGRRPPIAAFTATATPEVRDDIIALLGLEQPQVLVAGFDRPNIYLRVERVEDEEEKDARLPHLVRGRRALVYAATRKSAEAAASVLNASGVKASAYHAGLKEDERTRVQDAFARGALPVVCATNAFGMGIDRPDVDAVVHYAIPGSLEAYYQEIGRAGRDGRAATATLLWDPADVATREYLIDSPRRDRRERDGATRDPAEVARRKELEHRKLQRMIEYAGQRGVSARRPFFATSATPPRASAATPAATAGPAPSTATSASACETILTGIARAGERYGRHRIVAMLVGDTGDLPPALTGLSTTGSLRHESSDAIRGWIDASIAAGLIAVSTDQYRTLSLTDRGRDAMHGRLPDLGVRRPVTGAVPLSRRRQRIRDWNDWRALKRLRRRAWSADPDAPFEFDGDFSRGFDAPDE